MGEMMFSIRDLYPNYSGTEETSSKANPDTDDQVALNENPNLAEESTVSRGAKTKNVFLAMAVVIALVIFFGGGK